MSSLVAENDEQPSSSNIAQLNRSSVATESHNASSEEPAAEISTQAEAQPGTQAIDNATASISEATHTPKDEQNTGDSHFAGTDLSCPLGLQSDSTVTINPSLLNDGVTKQPEQADIATEKPALPEHDIVEDISADKANTSHEKQYTATTANTTPPENISITTTIDTDQADSMLHYRAWPRGLRRIQQVRSSRRSHPGSLVLSLGLLILLMADFTVPLFVTITYGLRAYQAYTQLRTHAESGYQHLLAVKAIFSGSRSQPTSLLDTGKLTRARQNFILAHEELVETQMLLDQNSFVHAITNYLPAYQPQVASARAACQIGIDIADIGQQATGVAITLAPRLHSPLLSTAKTPLVTQADLRLIGTTIDRIQPLISDIETQAQHLSLDTLPINAHQREQIQQILPLLPQAQRDLSLGQSLLGSANWLLGVDQPRTFLVQTLDRSELRATGGFTGQYGELKINQGRVAPFSLHDIALVEYAQNNPTLGNLAPQVYRSWWPFANWGLRDSNLSTDFPTSAQLAMQRYKIEMHQQVDGVISFTPFLIEHLLTVTGPITIPQYHETITAQNLENRLHYYQLDNKGIRKEEIVEKVPDSPNAPDQARKLFTARLSRMFMDHIRQAPPQELLAISKQLLTDLKTRDLQIYMSNPQIEGLLVQHGYAGQIDRSTTHDGIYIVQMNLSASKASQYVQTNVSDTVSLDATGGALHQFQMHLIYNQGGPVYGLDTYRDYIRIYVPPTAQYRSGDGFDTGQPLCGGVLGACPSNGIYPHNELVCPPGQYDARAAAPMLNDPYQGEYHPLDTIGGPTNLKSDEPGRAMFGGWVVIPKNCTMTVSLSWYVPAMGTLPYTLLVQRQASTFPQLDLVVRPADGACGSVTAPLGFNGELDEDTAFMVSRERMARAGGSVVSCGLGKAVAYLTISTLTVTEWNNA
jgi:Protein of unknown function (DUF4012)